MICRTVLRTITAITLGLAWSAAAWAQGGGASTTGTIQGRVTDASGGVLPGVTVTASSPALMGVQTGVTNETGGYRFPALPPGTYAISFELTGFNLVKRDGIQLSLGFTATINTELNVATVQESVTVSGASPVIDTSATRVQSNFRVEELNSIPNARDMWSLLSLTPSVTMTRIDVGGNRAGTQTGYLAYGMGNADQQVRVLVEGINTTEGTNGAGFYFDYGSFEEVFLGTAGQGAEMPHPGVQSQFLGKSGGNQMQGALYMDWYNNSLQGSNLPGAWLSPTAFGGSPLREHSNEMERYYDFNANAGGYVVKDRVWWYGSYRGQKNAVQQPNFLFDQTFDTKLWNLSGKGTYMLNTNHKLIGYYQWGQKSQPNRLFSTAYTYASPDYTRNQNSGSWVYKGEWNGTINSRLYVEARYGEFGYYFPLLGYGNEPWRNDTGTRVASGGDQRWQTDRQRRQATGAATFFVDRWLGGSHSVRLGGELNLETQWTGFERWRAGGIQHEFNNGVATQITLAFPTAGCEVGGMSARDCLLSIAKLDHYNAFVSDQWALGRMTINAGARVDHYQSHVPEQQQIASTIAGFSIPQATFAPQTFLSQTSVVPRIGVTYDLHGAGRSVVKANYGYYLHNPGTGFASTGNPNQSQKDMRFTWNDANGDRLFQFGEHDSLLQDRTGPGGITVAPDLHQPYTHEVSGFFEQQLSDTIGLRTGYVYKTADDFPQAYQPFRGPEAYTQPFPFVDIGADGARGTTDDRTLTFLAIPNGELSRYPATTVLLNTPGLGRWKTVEASLNKRMGNRWSAGIGYNFTWTKEHAGTPITYASNTVSPSFYPNSPNDTSLHEFTMWGLRAYGAIEAPWGIRLSPVFRHQSGQPYGRTINVQAPAGLTYSGTLLAEPVGTRRMDNINIIDIRAERSIRITGRTRLRAFVDFFNLTNSHAGETISFATGAAFERPTAVVAPRTARIGGRLEW